MSESNEQPMSRVAIVGYGGSTRSVQSAFERLGVNASITLDHDELLASDGIILPGNLTFGAAMRGIETAELSSVLKDALKDRTSVLGIGVGMQLFYESSPEPDHTDGLGLLAGKVERLSSTVDHKVPHKAWKPVEWRQKSPLNEGLDDACEFYHGHSYAVVPEDDSEILATAGHGEEFVTAVQRGTLYGVQFHPERSRPYPGIHLLGNFAKQCVRPA
jgi:imidazole glycerol-phosphate synthase subunit HisH